MTGRSRAGVGSAVGLPLAVLLAVGTAGCTANPSTAASTAFVTPTPPVDAESAGHAPAGARTDESATAADVAFVAAMVAHHEQAVELASLAPGRVADAELAELASRMAVVQAAEADAMRSWLDRRRSRDVSGAEHDQATAMPGEISRSTMDRAAELEGAAFDRLFVQAMIPHHRGAIEMAEARLSEAGEPAVTRWARAIAASQALEIDRLREIGKRLPAG
jgi:uncharacterized protein (DUF305 family)